MARFVFIAEILLIVGAIVVVGSWLANAISRKNKEKNRNER